MSEKFSEANLQNMDHAIIIHHLSKLSYDAAQEAQTRFRSPYKHGWSPEAMAHLAHLRALTEIRRQINGFQKKEIKGKQHIIVISAEIKRIVKKWKQAAMGKETEIENAWTLIDIIGIAPQRLLTWSQTQIQHGIEGQIVCVRNLKHRKLRSDLRQNQQSYCKKRESGPRREISKGYKIHYRTEHILLQCGLTTPPGGLNLH